MMNECQSKGLDLPRKIIKVYLNLLNLMRQNPGKTFAQVCGSIEEEINKGTGEPSGTEDAEEIEEL
jgi:hypothetical protein